MASGDKITVMDMIRSNDGSGSGLDTDLIRGLDGDFTSSLTENGYQKLPSGLIMQWGKVNDVDLNDIYAVTFPIAFNNVCLNVNVTVSYDGLISGTVAGNIKQDTLSTTGVTLLVDTSDTTVNGDIYWFAIGY